MIAEYFTQAIKQMKGQFIFHQVPKGLPVSKMVNMPPCHTHKFDGKNRCHKIFFIHDRTLALAISFYDKCQRPIVFLTAVVLLSACSNKLQPPSQGETIQISVYHPWPPSHIFKTSGDWALLDNGGSIQIESTKWAAIIGKTALPIPHTRVERDHTAWEKNFADTPAPGGVDAILDRKIGLICVGSDCARVYAICPSIKEMRLGKKCSIFKIK